MKIVRKIYQFTRLVLRTVKLSNGNLLEFNILLKKIQDSSSKNKFGRLISFVNAQPLEFDVKVNNYDSYSQDGEDMYLRDYFKLIDDGFFVDVGANHPVYLSNTFYLYKKGWTGINIDPNDLSGLYKKYRPKDVYIQKGVSSISGELKLFEYSATALNTFSIERVKELSNKGVDSISEKTVNIERLEYILDKQKVNKIDLLSIDVETMEMSVLESNNWEKYRPKLILVEILGEDINTLTRTEVHKYLLGKGYRLIAKMFRTAFYEYEN